MALIQIQWTAQDIEEAQKIIDLLLKQKLVACATIIDAVESHYIWQGQKMCTEEVKILMKTLDTHFREVAHVITEESSYDVPEILAFEVLFVSESYLKWVETQVASILK